MAKILVIEDAKDLRDDVVEMLNLEGFTASGAENGVVGVKAAECDHPDLIVCDIMMPELDGYGVLEHLRGNPSTATIPFIFLTARTDRMDMRQGMVLGADDYLTKPFRVSELLDSINSRLQKREGLNKLAEQRLEELRENIMSALPHELRTPLNTVIGFSDMLLAECQNIKPDQIADWSQHINIAARRLYRLVENYLYYARLQVISKSPEERELLQKEVTSDPPTIIEFNAAQKAQQTGREADVTYKFGDYTVVKISDHHLSKITEELIDNASKFSDAGTAIQVQGQLANEFYELVVKDHGRGMTADEISSVGAYMQFNRDFYEQQGMGLGLAIVRLIAELYGGSVTISSNYGHETTVCVRFPIA